MDKEEITKILSKIKDTVGENNYKLALAITGHRTGKIKDIRMCSKDGELLLEYVEQLEQQCKKQKEVIDKANKKLNNFIECCKAEKLESGSDYIHHQYWDMFERFNKQIKDILKEVE